MSLKNLQEISSLVTNLTKSNRFVELIDDGLGGAKYLQLMKGISNKAWETEEEAKIEIYGKELGDKTFDMLKSRAKERLVNLIFQLDTQKRFKSSYDKAYFSACKNLYSGAILFIQNRHNSGEEQLKLSLKISKQYYFTDLSLIALRLLRNNSGFTGPKHKYDKYNSELKNQKLIFDTELASEDLYYELALESILSIANKESLIEKSKNAFLTTKSLLKKFDTYTLRMSMYRSGLMFYLNSNEYKKGIELATDCEKYLNQNEHLIQKVRLGEMGLNKLYCSLYLRDYLNGSEYATTCMSLFNPGTVNWLIFLEYYFLLSLHTKNYSKASEIYIQVINHSSFDSAPQASKEKWKIFESFLVYALPEKVNLGRKFNVAKFINEVPLYSKDKAGYNFSIIIAQIILAIKIGDFNKVLDKSEALKLYASRYIRKEKNPRSYYFVKMLMLMIKYDFDANKTEQIANKFYIKLKESNLGEQSELETLEVIPYDILWPEILVKLQQTP